MYVFKVVGTQELCCRHVKLEVLYRQIFKSEIWGILGKRYKFEVLHCIDCIYAPITLGYEP